MNTSHQPSSQPISSVFAQQQARSLSLRYSGVSERIQRLKKLKQWIQQHRLDIQQAIYQDFKKPAFETDTSEILLCLREIDHVVKHLRQWASDQHHSTPITLPGTSAYVRYEPKGVCLIIAPWNYPFQLLVGPWISSIAAGNCNILKPSEMTPHTAILIAQMVTELFPSNEAMVFQGSKEVSQALLAHPFDHIFFTGSPAVGKHVMTAAAQHLSSVTLELGGKSPAVVDKTADLPMAAQRIAWGKFFNAGQTCITPDYVLVQESVKEELIGRLSTEVQRMYNPTSQGIANSTDYARMVTRLHTERLVNLLEQSVADGAIIESGGEHSVEEHYLAPTLITNVSDNTPLMQEEIFGPILPIISYRQLPEAVDFINTRPKPLSLYVFSERATNREFVLQRTSSGSAAINECVLQFSHPSLPFGGVNFSGMGKAHGYYGFQTFSNEKSVLKQRWGSTVTRFLLPPYSGKLKKRLGWIIEKM